MPGAGSEMVEKKKAGKAPAGPQVYVVQRRLAPTIDDVPGSPVRWEDVASVTVEPRSKRSTVIRAAIEQAGLVVGDAVLMRVLDAASAVEVPVGTRQPPLELVIG